MLVLRANFTVKPRGGTTAEASRFEPYVSWWIVWFTETPLKRSLDDHPSLGLIAKKLRNNSFKSLKKIFLFRHNYILSCHFIFIYILISVTTYLLKLFWPEVFYFFYFRLFRKEMTGGAESPIVMVAFKLEAPMLHTSSMVAHVKCNRRPHAEHASAREYLLKWLLALRRRQCDGDDDEERREDEDVRSDRVSTRLSDHACISSTRGSSRHVATRTTLYSEFSLADGLGKLRTAFSSDENEEWECSLFLSILPAFRFSFSRVSCRRRRHVTFTDVPESLFIFRSRECELHRNWTQTFYKIFFLML